MKSIAIYIAKQRCILECGWALLPCLWKAVWIWGFRGPYDPENLATFLYNHYPMEWNRVISRAAEYKRFKDSR